MVNRAIERQVSCGRSPKTDSEGRERTSFFRAGGTEAPKREKLAREIEGEHGSQERTVFQRRCQEGTSEIGFGGQGMFASTGVMSELVLRTENRMRTGRGGWICNFSLGQGQWWGQ